MINYLEHYQEIFLATFALIRKKYNHKGSKGSCNEQIIKDFLEELLPNSMKVGHGEIIDSYNKRSQQMDIVIVDSTLQPFIKDYDAPNIFIIEAITCAGEVKAILDNNSLQDALKKCATFKQLSTKNASGDIRFTNEHDALRFYHKRPFFIFAFESISTNQILDILNLYYKNNNATEQIDGIFTLDKGAIINFNGEGALQHINGTTKTTGFYHVSNETEILKSFVSWLFAVMPKVITFQNPIIHYL